MLTIVNIDIYERSLRLKKPYLFLRANSEHWKEVMRMLYKGEEVIIKVKRSMYSEDHVIIKPKIVNIQNPKFLKIQ